MAVFNPDYEGATPEYTKSYPFSEIIFPEDVPLCAKDLNELQRNFGFQVSTIAKNAFDAVGESNSGIAYIPFERDAVITLQDGTCTHNISINGLVATNNHVFKINTSKSIAIEASASEVVSLVMVPEVVTVDETNTDIKALGTDTLLPNYIASNKFLEGITKREALKVDFVLTKGVSESVVSETLNFEKVDEWDFANDFSSKTYTIPDGCKCVSVKLNASFSGDSDYLRFILKDSNDEFLDVFERVDSGEFVYTDIPDNAKYLYINAAEGVSATNTCAVDVEITYEAPSNIDGIEIYKAVGDKVVSNEIITPKNIYEDFHEYWSLYNQPYILSDVDKNILMSAVNGPEPEVITEHHTSVYNGTGYDNENYSYTAPAGCKIIGVMYDTGTYAPMLYESYDYEAGHVPMLLSANTWLEVEPCDKIWLYEGGSQLTGTNVYIKIVAAQSNEWYFPSYRIAWRGQIYAVPSLSINISDISSGGYTYLVANTTNDTVSFSTLNSTDYLIGNENASQQALLTLAASTGDDLQILPANFACEENRLFTFGRNTLQNIVSFTNVAKSNAKRYLEQRQRLNSITYLDWEKSGDVMSILSPVVPEHNEFLIERAATGWQNAGGLGNFEEALTYSLIFNLRPYSPSSQSGNNLAQLLLNGDGTLVTRTGTVTNNKAVYNEAKTLAFRDEAAQIGHIVIDFESDGWTLDSEAGLYAQSVVVRNLKESDIIFTDISLSSDKTTWDTQIDAYQCVRQFISSDGKITAYCTDEAPTAAFGVQLTAMRSNTNILN